MGDPVLYELVSVNDIVVYVKESKTPFMCVKKGLAYAIKNNVGQGGLFAVWFNEDGLIERFKTKKEYDEYLLKQKGGFKSAGNLKNDVDWDAIARGKVRTALVSSFITKGAGGVQSFTRENITYLERWVNYCMNGLPNDMKHVDDAEGFDDE